jgi:hypothetical protein
MLDWELEKLAEIAGKKCLLTSQFQKRKRMRHLMKHVED